MTLPEKVLWKALRKPEGFRRQAPIGRYIVDLVHFSTRLIIELDGGWHDFPEAQLHDATRDARLIAQGYRVIRFRNRQVLEDLDGLVDTIGTLLPQGEKGRVEGGRAANSGRDTEAPPALFLQPSALTLTQPSPIQGKGALYPDASEGRR